MDKQDIINNLKNVYFELAGTELAMSYFSFCESESDDEQEKEFTETVKKYSELRNRFKPVVAKCFDGNCDGIKEALEEAKKLREDLKAKVNKLILLGDRALIDEYVKSRTSDGKEMPNYGNDDDYAREILSVIFETRDNTIVNENILNAVYELPIRMTKQRFFDILEDGFKKYIGSPADILDKFVFLTESAAGISEVEEAADFDDNRVSNEIDYLTNLAENVNYAYALLETVNDADEVSVNRISEYGKMIENAELIAAGSENSADIIAESEMYFEKSEGMVENLMEKVNSLSCKVENITNSEADKYNTEKMLFDKLGRLLSNSIFAELEAQDESVVDEAVVMQKYAEIREKLEAVFAGDDRRRNRAVMAAVLKELPVFFNSKTDVMNYVREALSGCRDVYEKSVAVSRLMQKIRG